MGKGSGIADKRVRDLLDYHMSLLGNDKNKFEANTSEMAYYLIKVPWGHENDYVRIGYKRRKSKLLTRTFDLEFTTSINEILFDDSFETGRDDRAVENNHGNTKINM